MLTLLVADDERTVASDGLLLNADALLEATGWELKEHGLCRGEACVPTRLAVPVSLADVATALGRPLATATMGDRVVAVLGEPVGATAGPGEQVVGLQLSDVDGTPLALGGRGRKTAVVAWSSWCGCRYELPSWKQLAGELAVKGLDVITVALDEAPDAVRPWVPEGLATAVDPDHRVSDVFGIGHVPSTVWLDEQDRVVKPPTLSPGDNQFQEFTQVDATAHHDALRRWVADGEVPEVAAPADSLELRAARAERRLAAWLHRHGHSDLAEEHFEAAVALAPLDFSIRRSSMPLRGQDPFGTEFFELWEEWSAAGRPGYDSL